MVSHQDTDILHRWSQTYARNVGEQIVDPLIQRNSIFGLPENVLLVMITHERLNTRIRFHITKAKSHVSAIKFADFKCHCSTRPNITTWSTDRPWRRQPPVTIYLTDNELKYMISAQISSSVLFLHFPYLTGGGKMREIIKRQNCALN